MPISRPQLEKMLDGVENKDDIINYVMSENGKTVNELKAQLEETKSKGLELEQQVAEAQTHSAKYDEIEKALETATQEIAGYKAKEENEGYFKTLREVGFNEEFVNEDIFKKIPKGETFKTDAEKFLKEKPVYAAESYTRVENIYGVQGGNRNKSSLNPEDLKGKSDAEALEMLKNLRK